MIIGLLTRETHCLMTLDQLLADPTLAFIKINEQA